MLQEHLSKTNSRFRILAASLIGNAIEFFDFYIYSTSAVLVFPKLFFPSRNETAAMLESLATFALAFFARPLGAILFGHFGDRIGRKKTLVISLLTMGLCTVAVGLIPPYAQIGIAAPIMLALLRIGQGIGLGGEWGGAVLLATENAPEGKKEIYGMFPQLGAPVGLFLCSLSFYILSYQLTSEQFLSWGWRIPFVCSIVLVGVGLFIRLKINETPEFETILKNKQQVKLPLKQVLRRYPLSLITGIFTAITVFVFFYIISVFSLGWSTSKLGYSRNEVLVMQMISMFFFMAGIYLSALVAGKIGQLNILIYSTIAVLLFGMFFSFGLISGHSNLLLSFFCAGFFFIGFNYGPLGTWLSGLFPAEVRFTGSSLAFTLAGIIGGSVTPLVAMKLANTMGVDWVGYFLAAGSFLSLVVLLLHRNRSVQS